MKLKDYFRDYTAESMLFARRAIIAFIVIILLFAVLIGNLYRLQIVDYTLYQTRSNENRIKLVPIPPSRGIIFDRNGIALAVNRTVYQLEMVPGKVSDVQQTLEALRPIVNLTDDDIDNFKKARSQTHRFAQVTIKSDLDDEEVARFTVRQYRFPGVEIREEQRRYYPYRAALTHLVGYVSKINEKDVVQLKATGQYSNYTATHDIGKLGIERYYESVLHGTTGYEEVEVNNRGRVVRQIKKVQPQAGHNIYLTLDLKLQLYIESLLAGTRSAAVVTDPRSGAILAMVSMPSYDPNPFVEGISNKAYNALLHDPDTPLINRASQGLYPPASTVKPFVAVSALTTGVISTTTTLFDPGWWQLPGTQKRYRDWKRSGHGTLNVTKALEESADTFFYQVAYDMGIDRLSSWMSRFGYGTATGIDLYEENTGNMPTRNWKMARYHKPWYKGDTIPVGIGQGYWTSTPLQMNKALMTLINDGNIKTPHLLKETIIDGNAVDWQPADSEPIADPHSGYWEVVKNGMYGMANRSNGTGHRYFASAPYKIAGKSGTAQVFSLKANEVYNAHRIAAHLRDHALMTAYAPYDDPQVAISLILENGGSGTPAGTIVRKILDYVMIGEASDTSTPTPLNTPDTNIVPVIPAPVSPAAPPPANRTSP